MHKLHILNGLHKQSIEIFQCQNNVIFIWSSTGRKRTSVVSHNEDSKTYKNSNKSVPSDSQTQSIKNFFTAIQPIEHDDQKVRNVFEVKNFKWTYNFHFYFVIKHVLKFCLDKTFLLGIEMTVINTRRRDFHLLNAC